ncbi:MAG: DegT/DnrJ/EryC1/StrS aminotransferase family protein [Chitinophagaceae bacterium]
MHRAVPVNTPSLTGNEAKYLQECIDTGWISAEGPFVNQFESQFSKYIGRQFGIAVSNGSGALDIAVQALHIGPGDEVILPTFTIISPAFSIVRAGALPVLVDSHPLTWNMDTTKIEERITSRTKAILVVHLYGLPADMDPIIAIAEKYKLFIIEDAAEMIGQEYKDKKCGSFGHISTFSFYSNKHITTGEGGMLLCDDQTLAERCKKLRNLAFEPHERRFVHFENGWNYRMTNLQAALGVAQLEKIDQTLIKKKASGKYYHNRLSFLTHHNYELPLSTTTYAENIYWIFGLVAPDEIKLRKLLEFLSVKGIATRPFFWCMHEQPVFNKLGLFGHESYPVAEKLARTGFYLPGGTGISTEDMEFVTAVITEYFSKWIN